MKVVINIKGSSILYYSRTSRVWNVVFITDRCHNVKFFDPDVTSGPVILGQNFNREIIFSAVGMPAAIPPDPVTVDEFLNMSSNDLHGERSRDLSNLDVRRDLKNGRRFIHMTIPFGRLGVTEYTDAEYNVQPEGSTPHNLDRVVVSEFAITFEIKSSAGLHMVINDLDSSGQTTTSHPKDFSGKALLHLRFDNFCDEPQVENDFIHYYDWLFDSRSPDPGHPIRFLAGKNRPSVEPSEESSPPPGGGLQGDCDPVIIEPPPGP